LFEQALLIRRGSLSRSSVSPDNNIYKLFNKNIIQWRSFMSQREAEYMKIINRINRRVDDKYKLIYRKMTMSGVNIYIYEVDGGEEKKNYVMKVYDGWKVYSRAISEEEKEKLIKQLKRSEYNLFNKILLRSPLLKE
jgi:hypothetical protein